jgi:hypothetical protein
MKEIKSTNVILSKSHPIQPMEMYEDDKIIRFKKNSIVILLLNSCDIDMNKLAMMNFSNDDRSQFAQLIGYSYSGFVELPYVEDKIYKKAKKKFNKFKGALKLKKIIDPRG